MKTSNKLRAFHGAQALKEMFLDRVRDNRKHGKIIQDYFFNEEDASEKEAGIPSSITSAQYYIQESLPEETRAMWSERYFGAIPVGADLRLVPCRFAVWMLTSEDSVYFTLIQDEATKQLMGEATGLINQEIEGKERDLEKWKDFEERAHKAYRLALIDLAQGNWSCSEQAIDRYNLASRLVYLRVSGLSDPLLPISKRPADLMEKFAPIAAEKLLQLLAESIFEKCPRCKGAKTVEFEPGFDRTCPDCNGTGSALTDITEHMPFKTCDELVAAHQAFKAAGELGLIYQELGLARLQLTTYREEIEDLKEDVAIFQQLCDPERYQAQDAEIKRLRDALIAARPAVIATYNHSDLLLQIDAALPSPANETPETKAEYLPSIEEVRAIFDESKVADKDRYLAAFEAHRVQEHLHGALGIAVGNAFEAHDRNAGLVKIIAGLREELTAKTKALELEIGRREILETAVRIITSAKGKSS